MLFGLAALAYLGLFLTFSRAGVGAAIVAGAGRRPTRCGPSGGRGCGWCSRSARSSCCSGAASPAATWSAASAAPRRCRCRSTSRGDNPTTGVGLGRAGDALTAVGRPGRLLPPRAQPVADLAGRGRAARADRLDLDRGVAALARLPGGRPGPGAGGREPGRRDRVLHLLAVRPSLQRGTHRDSLLVRGGADRRRRPAARGALAVRPPARRRRPARPCSRCVALAGCGGDAETVASDPRTARRPSVSTGHRPPADRRHDRGAPRPPSRRRPTPERAAAAADVARGPARRRRATRSRSASTPRSPAAAAGSTPRVVQRAAVHPGHA